MKPVGLIGTGILLLLLGAVVPTYAMQDQHEQDAKPSKQDEKAKPAQQEKQAKPEKQQEAKAPKQEQQAKPEKQQETKPVKQEKQAKPEKQQEAKAVRQEKPAKPEKQQETKPVKQEKQAKPEKQQEANSQQDRQQQQRVQRSPADEQRQRAVPALRLSARGDGRIPDDRFRSNFGREHHFRVGNPQIVDGYSRFQYSGFWFGFVEPWPDGWYYTDDVYVDFVDGGYYLYNPYYPGVRIAINVVL